MDTRTRAPSIFTPPDPEARLERCVTCGEVIDSPFCGHCGEMRASDRSHSIWDFVKEHVVTAVGDFDGRVIRSFRALVIKPGELTFQFMRGSRLPYLAPLQLFLLCNLAFFLWSGATKTRILDTPLSVHVRGMVYSGTARAMVLDELRRTKEEEKVYSARFNTVGSTQAKSLVVVMVPAFALFVGLVTLGLRRRRPFVQHLVFSFHLYSWFLLFLIVSAYVLYVPVTFVLARLGVEAGVYGYDAEYSIALLAVFSIYTAAAYRRAYDLPRVLSGLAGVTSVLAAGIIVQAYRALLFFVTFYST